jgi:cytochrome oxidase Cu insertion factor (SCO1/SenC/PrrC family)
MSSNGEGLSIHDPDMPVGHRRIKKKKKSVSPVALVASIMLSVVILAGAGFAGYVIIKRALDRAGPIAAGDIAIGKPAPEIEGEDIDGNRFKLSDYHGKVVVLDFWGNW